MRLTIVYTTQLKAALKIGTEQIDIAPPASVGELLGALAQRHGDEFRRLTLDTASRPISSLLVCVGDQQISSDAPLKLNDGDVITLLGAISGG